LFLIVVFGSCKKENRTDCFKGNGDDVTEERDLGSFKIIKVYDKINLNIIKGQTQEFKVEVVAGKHVIKNITTKIADNVLSIDNVNKCNFVRGYKRQVTVNVTLPYIVKVENQGVGTVVFAEGYSQDTLLVLAESSGDIHINGNYNEIRTSSHGNGDIYLSGTCNSLYVYMNGINFFRGANMPVTNYIFVETLSIGDCYINATQAQKLDYHIWDAGNIYYTGNPPVINDVSDGTQKGKLIQQP